MAGYGMAECSLAVSFSKPGRGLMIDHIDPEPLSVFRQAMPLEMLPDRGKSGIRSFVNCGEPIPGFEFQVRDEQGRVLPERHIGTLYVREPSVITANTAMSRPHGRYYQTMDGCKTGGLK